MKRFLLALALLASCGRPTPDVPVRPHEPIPLGTTTFKRLGGRQTAAYPCTVDLATGKATVGPRGIPDPPYQSELSQQVSQGGRTYRILQEDNKRTRKLPEGEPAIPGFPDRVRVTVVEVDDASGNELRRIPIQEFVGEHEQHLARSLRLEDGQLRFWMDFCTHD